MHAAKKQHKYSACVVCFISGGERCSRIKRKWSLRLDVIARAPRAPDFRSSLIAKSLAFIHSSTLARQTLWHVNIYLQVLMCQPFPLNGANFALALARSLARPFVFARYKFKQHSSALKLKCPLLRERSEERERPLEWSPKLIASHCFSIQIRTLTLPMINLNFLQWCWHDQKLIYFPLTTTIKFKICII